jgi:hypothetical protein
VPKAPQARKSFWTHTTELLGDVGHVESRFSPFGYYVNVGPFGDSANLDARLVHGWRLTYHGDSVNVCARLMHGLCPTYHKLRNYYGCTQWSYLVTWVMWDLVSVRLGIVLILMLDWYTVCAKCTIGLEIILDAPDGTPR